MINLNEFRKQNPQDASLIIRQIFDNCCMEVGLENNTVNMLNRINEILGKVM